LKEKKRKESRKRKRKRADPSASESEERKKRRKGERGKDPKDPVVPTRKRLYRVPVGRAVGELIPRQARPMSETLTRVPRHCTLRNIVLV
jgi:hypothetical protein